MNDGELVLAREIHTRAFGKGGQNATHKAAKDQRMVILKLGDVNVDSLPHFRAEGVMAAFGFHKIPNWQLPEEERRDCLRWRFARAAAAGEAQAEAALVQAVSELGIQADEAYFNTELVDRAMEILDQSLRVTFEPADPPPEVIHAPA